MNSPNKSATEIVADFLFLPFFQTPLIPNSRKNEVYFNFPEVQPVLSKKKGTCSFSFPEPQPILSHIRNFRKIKNFSKRYYSLRSGTTTSSTTASGFGCDTSFFGLSRWSGNVYATDKLTFK